jgi:alpha-galactosidase
MMGKLGFDIVVSKLNGNDLKFCQDAITAYNSLKPVIWQGDQYRLSDPRTESVASIMYVDSLRSTGVMFNYLVNYRYGEGSKFPILLKGLDPAKKYQLKEINVYPGTRSVIDSEKIYSGDFLMRIGFNPQVNASHTSVVIQINEVK